MAGRDFINNIIKDVLFGISQGYSASAQYRGSQARSAGIGAALGAAPLRQQLLLKQQQDQEDRKLQMEQIRAQIAQSGNAQALQVFNAAQGSMAQETPLSIPPGMSQDPRAQGQVFQGDTQMAPSQLPAMNVGGQMLRPQSAQDQQRIAGQLLKEKAGIDLDAMRQKGAVDLQNRIAEIKATAENRAAPVTPQLPSSLQEYAIWASQQKKGADTSFDKFMKARRPPSNAAEPGSYFPITDSQGRITSWVNPKMGKVVNAQDLGIGENSYKGAISPERQKMQENAKSGLRAITTLRDELKKPGTLAALAVPGSPTARKARAARAEMIDVMTRLRTGAALNADEQKFYNDQAPGLIDSLFNDPDTIPYKLSIFEQEFQGLSGEKPTGGWKIISVK